MEKCYFQYHNHSRNYLDYLGCGSCPSDCRCALEIGPKKRDKRQLFLQSYRTPTQTQKHAYNLFVEQKIEEQRHLDNWNCTKAFDTLADILIQSADKCFTRIPAEQKKPYVSETTWNLIEAKQKAIEADDFIKAWSKAQNTVKWKLRVFDSILKSAPWA